MATNEFEPPEQFVFDDENVSTAESWTAWKRRYELFLFAKEAHGKPDQVKIGMLLTCMGREAVRRFDNIDWKAGEDKTKYDHVLKKWDELLDPEDKEIMARFQFWNKKWPEEKGFSEIYNELKCHEPKCKFLEPQNMLRDKILFTHPVSAVQRRLLREQKLTLEKTVQICTLFEQTAKEVKLLKGLKSSDTDPHTDQDVDAVRKFSKGAKGAGRRFEPAANPKCKYCGKRHKYGSCPAYGKECYCCGQRNHFANQCTVKPKISDSSKEANRQKGRKQNHRVNELQTTDDSESSEEDIDMLVETVQLQVDSIRNTWYEVIRVQGLEISMKVDSGGQCNTITKSVFEKLRYSGKIENSSMVLRSYSGAEIPHCGKVQLWFRSGKTVVLADCYVVTGSRTPILGLRTSLDLRIISHGSNARNCPKAEPKVQVQRNLDTVEQTVTKEYLQREWSDLFEGLGKFPGEHKIRLKSDTVPTVKCPFNVPQKLQAKFKLKLQSMVNNGVIEPVDYPTQWVHRLAIAEKKSGELRLCINPEDMNPYVEREHFKLPTFDDILPHLNGKKIYSVFDQKDAFWHVKLDDESTELCTFATPGCGRFKFLRLPFGLSSASEVLQKKTYQIFGDIPDVYVIADDILIASSSMEEHGKTIQLVLERARKNGVKFNLSKIKLNQSSVIYMGNKLDRGTVKLDPEKVSAVMNMRIPEKKEDIQKLVGLLNFLDRFIPDKAEHVSPLCDLMKTNVPFIWEHQQQQAFETIVHILASEPVLRMFNPAEQIVIQCDASKNGLGACLMQGNQPIRYASRALNDTEQRYAQIEKELLAIVFAAEKFHHYIYGNDVLVQSDHKPLQTIVKKSIHKATPRIQLMLMRLWRYKLEVKYVPGSKLYIADTLSRAVDQSKKAPTAEQVDEDNVFRVHGVTEDFHATAERLKIMREETAKDHKLQKLMGYVQNGWPRYKGTVDPDLQVYWQVRDEIFVEHGLLFLGGGRLIVPKSQWKHCLKLSHEGHLGIEKCTKRLQKSLYWPRMAEHVKDYVSNCKVCAKHAKSQAKVPLKNHDIPNLPWYKVGADIFEFQKQNYLLIVDYYSKYPEVIGLGKSKTAQSVIRVCESVFARHGIPSEFFSDNMPFASREFKEFATEWGMKLTTSSPRYPQSNGQSERCIGTIKNLLKKALEDKKDIYVALLQYRNTPISNGKYSPAELLFSRSLNDKLPTSPKLLKPKIAEDAKDDLTFRQWTQKRFYDRKAMPERNAFSAGDRVRVKEEIWQPAKILSSSGPRSYRIEKDDGTVLRRNEKVLRKDTSGSDQNQNRRKAKTVRKLKREIVESDSVSDGFESDREENQNQNDNHDHGGENVENPNPDERPQRNLRIPAHLKDYQLSSILFDDMDIIEQRIKSFDIKVTE